MTKGTKVLGLTKSRHAALLIAAGLCALTGAARAAEKHFTAGLDPVAFDNANFADVTGEGTVSAELDGDTLVLTGSFADLPSAATSAHLQSGLAVGVPGPAIADVPVPHAAGGAISARIKLNVRQVEALQKGAVYLQINSEKAPDGNLWGWFLNPSLMPQ